MKIEQLNAASAGEWDSYVMGSPHSNCYHLYGWKEVIEKSFGHRTFYFYARGRDGKIKGVFPVAHLNSLSFGNFMVSLPYFNYGGIASDSPEAAEMLLEAAVRKAKELRAGHLEIRDTSVPDVALQVKKEKVSMRLELPRDPDTLWDSFPAKLRSQIKRPLKEGMYAKVGGLSELDGFYEVFSTNMRDLGTPVYSRQFFHNILTAFPGRAWVCNVYDPRKTPVASGFLVAFKDTIEIPWASSLRGFNRFSPNMLLYWSALKFSCEKGYGSFDFGRSTDGESTFRFKAQWGAKPVQLYWSYWLSNGSKLPAISPKNPKYRIFIGLWKKLPVGLTRVLGPRIVKNIP